MRAGIHISHGYKDGFVHFIDDLKAVIAPVTIAGKEYVAVVKNDGAWILRVVAGSGTCFEEETIFPAIARGAVIFIGLIPVDSENVQVAVCCLIHEYWEKMRMGADKEAAIMYSTPTEQQGETVM